MARRPFHFKKFSVEQADVAHPVGTDGVLLGAWADIEGRSSVLDIGTGTGLLALMLAQRFEAAGSRDYSIDAVEINSASAQYAGRNFEASPWAGRLRLWEMAVQDFAAQTDRRFDLIVSNPPFYTEAVAPPDSGRRLARHSSALPPVDLLGVVKKLLTDEGCFCAIMPYEGGRSLCERAVWNGLYCTKWVEVRSRTHKPVERLLLYFEKTPRPFQSAQMTVYSSEGVYSDAFRVMTEAFYLQ